jgi:hypothetical protein
MYNKLKIVHKEISKEMLFYNTSNRIEKSINKWAEECMNLRLKGGHHYLQFYKHSGTLGFNKRVVEKDPCTLYFSSDLLGETDDDYTVMKITLKDMITDFIEWIDFQDEKDCEYVKQVIEGMRKQANRLEKVIK